ncbi:alkaline phosphatase family protein [Neomicrococcus lactis]|uniref:Putative AlkP superfamily pyrophosphatase or phosphodiesterase n=1 Tax=Neomicrococcus lactis TaxID=732241 RepID=A0A7W9DAC6_9MICC|nr:putative AlkP superfamily pyrophosphatase or phosphodiesterase [Neomicrococcus lactis]
MTVIHESVWPAAFGPERRGTLPPVEGHTEPKLTPTIADVLSSAVAVLGVPGVENTLGLPEARRVCVILVDGLGLRLLKKRAAYAPFLKSVIDSNRPLEAAFPSTTATSLASFGTGLPPGQHGLAGYDAVDPVKRRTVNQLSGWPDDLIPDEWQPHRTLFERASEVVNVTTVSKSKFEESSLTRAALRGGNFVAAGSLTARAGAALEALKAPESLVYFYWDEIDKAGHRFGSESDKWTYQLEELDSGLKRFIARVPANTLVLLTADHGMVDIPASQRIDFSEFPELLKGIELTSGEPRCVQLHFEQDATAEVRQQTITAWRERFTKQAVVMERHEVIARGLLGENPDPRVLGRFGDVFVLCHAQIALYDGRRVAPHAFDVIGQHGSLTAAERLIPLLTLKKP